MISGFLHRIHRGEGWFFGGLKRFAIAFRSSSLPVPDFLKGVLRSVYETHYLIRDLIRNLLSFFYSGPLFRSRCETAGKGLHVWLMPHVVGPVKVYVGDDVKIFGHVGIMSSSRYAPRLVIGDGVNLGHNVSITVNKEVVIEERCNIASGVRIVDSDAHPRNTEDRIKGMPPPPDEVKPVRICKWAWLSADCMIMKGVTVGEGAVVGAGSIVVVDVPPYSIVMGNPARVVVKDTRVASAPPAAS
jgi:acetyltransferase-like isoleucine patch superfamily enzyme